MSVSNLLSCEPCRYRGLTSSAVKYCKSCQEQLCKDCVDFHKSFKVTRDHLLVNTEDQNFLKLCLNVENLRICKEHLNKQTEFYCLTHNAFLCSLCLLKSEQHRNCISEIVEIECVGKSLIGSKFTDTARGEFRNMIVSARHIVNGMTEAKDTTSKSVEAIKSEADALRRKVFEVLDEQIQKIVKKAATVNKENNDTYAKTIENLEKVIKEAEDNEKISETILQSGTPADVFRCLISVLQQMGDFKIETDQLSKGNYKKEIVTMVKSDLMKQLETHEKPLIDFHVRSSKITFCPAFPNGGIKNTTYCITE
ncbi:E3 ubiquitin-protein ligase TRIM33-like [Mercenaria mercenaria]|uniref:E3 ubiquitin-protein ligase TRIM33-like n=1 Tax=Mercenaria mercenaria TaxID=6596 RepID=UPI00234E6033|nr:E3 ubiquitin-protein ligase TRIM33-like [Mercenaria mercenaria]XP_053408041.1 E3 ubiquitin-protein ligase TRIM33-like [Mercenaria mercenaria]